MADFTSSFWNWYIIIPTVAGIIACFLLVRWLSGGELPSGEEAKSMGHVWDENLEELNNPLPSWWLKMFYITLVFGLAYIILDRPRWFRNLVDQLYGDDAPRRP